MDSINEVTYKNIEHLTADDLPKLLHALIINEAKTHRLEDFDYKVPFNITSGDEGSDGRAQWSGNSKPTFWLKNKYTIFQCKATSLSVPDCQKEVLANTRQGEPKALKKEIKKVVDENGCYILFTNKGTVDSNDSLKVDSFKKAFDEAGFFDFKKDQILIYDANKIKDWVNQFTATVTLVQRFNGIERLIGAKVFDEWKANNEFIQNQYESDDIINDYISNIREEIEKVKVIRVYGHSGLGKTRLVFEAFNNFPLSNALVYYNLEGNSNIEKITNYLNNYQEKQSGIIVIDNCNTKQHLILSKLVKQYEGHIRIITIGFDDSADIEDRKIKLERDKQRNIVRGIIENRLGLEYSMSEKEYVNSICEGYPWMAIKFCKSILENGMSELNNIPIEEFIQKLIFGSKPDEINIEYNVIRACSVFSSFGFIEDSFRELYKGISKKSNFSPAYI